MGRAKHTAVSFNVAVGDEIRNLGKKFSPQRVTAINLSVGDALVKKFGAYLYSRSLTRHKTANRLGVKPTGMLEFSQTSPSYNKLGGKIVKEVRGNKLAIVIKGVAGIMRAFKSLDIYPRKAKALTIPVAKEAYAKRAAQVEASGWKLFVAKKEATGKAFLFGSKGGITKPLFALLKHTHIKRDPKLLPSEGRITEWASAAVLDYMSRKGIAV